MEERKLLIFDMDGVILDSEPLHENARQRMFRELKINMSEKMPDPVGKSSSGFWRKVLENCALEGAPYELEARQYQLVAEQIETNHVQPSEGLLDIIQEARDKGMKIGLASSSTRMLVNDALRLLKIEHLFDYTLSGDEAEKKKPAPDIYLKVLELAEVSSGEAMTVEDSHAGVESAHQAGIFCYGYRNPTSGPQDISQADRIINHLGEIIV